MDIGEMEQAPPDWVKPNIPADKKTKPLAQGSKDTVILTDKSENDVHEMHTGKIRPEPKQSALSRRNFLKLVGVVTASTAIVSAEESFRQHKSIFDIVKSWLNSKREVKTAESHFEINDSAIEDYNLTPIEGANLPQPLAGQTGYVNVAGLNIERPEEGFRIECDDATWKAFGLLKTDYPNLKLVLSTNKARAITPVQGNRIPTIVHELKYVWFENQQGLQTALLFDPGNGNSRAEVITKFLQQSQSNHNRANPEGFVGKVISGRDPVGNENRVIFAATRIAKSAENIKANQLQPKNT